VCYHLNSFCGKLCILAIYRSPLDNLGTFLSNFDLIFNRFFNLKFNFIICGDININYLVEIFFLLVPKLAIREYITLIPMS